MLGVIVEALSHDVWFIILWIIYYRFFSKKKKKNQLNLITYICNIPLDNPNDILALACVLVVSLFFLSPN